MLHGRFLEELARRDEREALKSQRERQEVVR
jgi:hypothetical protein